MVEKTLNLFSPESEIKLNGSKLGLIRLSDKTKISGFDFSSFSELVFESEDLYPGIDKWFNKKVVPGIKNGKRIAYIVFHDGKAIAEAIVKFSAHTKLCSMRVDPKYQGKGIGPFLFAQIARELDNSIKTIHFTAPESLVVQRTGLFNDLGFIFGGKVNKEYRKGEDEIVFQAKATNFYQKSIELISKKIAKNIVGGSTPGILLSIKEEYANKIFAGKKTIELRRKFSQELKGNIALIYATKPMGKVVGDALISDVITDHPKKIWKEFNLFLGCTKEEFEQYSEGTTKISALFLTQVAKYPHPYDWDIVMDTFIGIKRPPQSYQKLPLATLSFWGSLASTELEPDEDHTKELSLGL